MLSSILPILHWRIYGHSFLLLSFLFLTTMQYLPIEMRVKRVTQLWNTIKLTGIFVIKREKMVCFILPPSMSGSTTDLIMS